MEEGILERIYKAALKFLAPLSSQETYKTIVNEAIKLVSGDDGAVLLKKGQEFVKVYSSSESIANIKTLKSGFAYRAFLNREAFLTNTNEFEKAQPEYKETGIRSVLFIPLSYKNQSIGTLAIRSFIKGPKFFEKDLSVLNLFGSFASLAIRKNELYEETANALKIRDQFIAMAAHELRTPLTTISGYTQLLKSKMAGRETSESRWVDQLSSECNRLTILVHELLETNRIGRGEVEYRLKERRLKEIINKVVINFKINHSDREVVLKDQKIVSEGFIIGDINKLCQALENILDNSAKFSNADSPITLDLKDSVNFSRIFVKDQGLGIKPDELKKVTDRFYIGSNHKREGLGLGLYLAFEIIKNHRGTMKVKSKPNKGTVVEIKIPKHDR